MELSVVQIIAAMVNFFVLFFLLKKYLYKPVLDMLEAREKEIADNLSNAETAKTEAESMRQEYEENLRQAHTKANDIVQQATKVGEQTRNDIVQQAKAEAQGVADKAKAEIAREKEMALQELRGEVANLAVDVAEKVVGRSVDINDHKNMMASFLNEAEEAK